MPWKYPGKARAWTFSTKSPGRSEFPQHLASWHLSRNALLMSDYVVPRPTLLISNPQFTWGLLEIAHQTAVTVITQLPVWCVIAQWVVKFMWEREREKERERERERKRERERERERGREREREWERERERERERIADTREAVKIKPIKMSWPGWGSNAFFLWCSLPCRCLRFSLSHSYSSPLYLLSIFSYYHNCLPSCFGLSEC